MKRSAALFSRLLSESHHRVFRELENRSHPPSFCRKQPSTSTAGISRNFARQTFNIHNALSWPASVSGRSDGESSFPVSYLQGVIRNGSLLRAAYRVLFTKRYSLGQPSRSNRPCLVYKALFTTTTFPEQSIVSCLHGVIHHDNLLGAIDRVLFTRRYSVRHPSRSSRPCLVYKALFITTFSEQPNVSCLLGVIRDDNLLGADYCILLTRRFRY